MKYVGRRKGGEIRGTHGSGTKTDVPEEMCKSGTEANKA